MTVVTDEEILHDLDEPWQCELVRDDAGARSPCPNAAAWRDTFFAMCENPSVDRIDDVLVCEPCHDEIAKVGHVSCAACGMPSILRGSVRL